MKLAGQSAGAYVGVVLRSLLEHAFEHPEDNTREGLNPVAKRLLELNLPR